MRIVTTLLLLLGLAPLWAQSFGDVIITEIMNNPSAVTDENGEWFEVYNTTGSNIDIDGWRIQTINGLTHVINNGDPLLVPANGFLVLGRNATRPTNGDYTCNYAYGADIVLTSGVAHLSIGSPNGPGFTRIDSVRWGAPLGFPNPNGASISLTDFTADRNTGSNWTAATVREFRYFSGTGDLGSPGTLGTDQELPVSLSAFNTIVGDEQVTLRWVTESEKDNAAFQILRAFDKNDTYQQIGEVAGQYTTNQRTTYSFVDPLFLEGATFWYKLVTVEVNGEKYTYGPIAAQLTGSGVDLTQNGRSIPQRFEVYQNYPNPFNPETRIKFDIPAVSSDSRATLVIYNTLGQQVRVMYDANILAGSYEVTWNGRSDAGVEVPAGIYFAVLRHGVLRESIKMVYTK